MGWPVGRDRVTAAISSLVVAGIGSLLTHQLAYLLAFPASSTGQSGAIDHGHMSLLWAILTPASILAAATLVLRQARGLGFGSHLSGRTLAVLTVGLFAAQEWTEMLLAHGEVAGATSGALTSPAVLAGLALAPLIGSALARFLAAATAVLAAFVAVDDDLVVPEGPSFAVATVSWAPVQLLRVAPTRGPPGRIR